jgi:CRP/FNR family transcriptional regulator
MGEGMNETEKYVSFKLPESVHKQLKHMCVSEDLSVQDYLSKLVTDDLADYALRPKSSSHDETRKDLVTALQITSIFKHVSIDRLWNLAEAIVQFRVHKGELIQREGEVPHVLYLVRDGKVCIFKVAQRGSDHVVAVRQSGDTFALLSTVTNQPSHAWIRALEDTNILTVKRDAFIYFLGQNPELMETVIECMLDRIQSSYQRLATFSGEKTEQRLVDMLLELSSKEGDLLDYTHQEIADMIGSTMETTTRLLTNLKRSGVLSMGRGSITILNKEALNCRKPGFQSR